MEVIVLPYVETIEHITESYNGKEYPVTITRRRGLHTFTTPRGETVLVDLVTIADAGKLGVTTCFTPHRDYTEEQRAAGRKAILENAAYVRIHHCHN
jgi:hypothetical protein